MIETLKRFFRARGGLRFKILYALDAWKDAEKMDYFVCESLTPGTWAKISRNGYINKRDLYTR